DADSGRGVGLCAMAPRTEYQQQQRGKSESIETRCHQHDSRFSTVRFVYPALEGTVPQMAVPAWKDRTMKRELR
ncbi:unnamed protein product, partial [marine sediment metagenome]